MSVATKNRTGRPFQFKGQFIDCRHYSSKDPTRRLFYCDKYQTEKTTCEGCPTCPKCDSILFTYRMVLSQGRDAVHADHAKSCIICGAYIEEHLRFTLAKVREQKRKDACEVHGCKNTAYEAHQHSEEVDGRQASFQICESHRRRVKTWRLHPSKGEIQKPLVIEDGQLVDNPMYAPKYAPRKGKQ